MRTGIWATAILSTALIAGQRAEAQTGSYKLTINIPDFGQRTGTIRVGLVSKAENFMGKSDRDTAVAVPATGPLTITIPSLKAGTYAVQLYQDTNGNKKLDRDNGMPTEPFGFSNISMLMGPPTFEEAAAKIKQDTDIRIRLMGN